MKNTPNALDQRREDHRLQLVRPSRAWRSSCTAGSTLSCGGTVIVAITDQSSARCGRGTRSLAKAKPASVAEQHRGRGDAAGHDRGVDEGLAQVGLRPRPILQVVEQVAAGQQRGGGVSMPVLVCGGGDRPSSTAGTARPRPTTIRTTYAIGPPLQLPARAAPTCGRRRAVGGPGSAAAGGRVGVSGRRSSVSLPSFWRVAGATMTQLTSADERAGSAASTQATAEARPRCRLASPCRTGTGSSVWYWWSVPPDGAACRRRTAAAHRRAGSRRSSRRRW